MFFIFIILDCNFISVRIAMELKENNTEKQKTRSLKIQPQIRQNRLSQKTVPEIKLSGKWLNDLGFTPAHYVTVTAEEKMLIIRLVE
jgi:hypothetical protein